MGPASNLKKELVLIGGGHTHVQVIRALTMQNALSGIRVTLISDESSVCYSGMLPGCLAGLYRPDEIEMDLRPLCNWAGVRFIKAQATRVDPVLQEVYFQDGRPPYTYDVLSINIGSTARGMETPGVTKYAVPTRPLGSLLQRVHQFETLNLSRGGPLRVVIAGGGAAGVELAFAMHSRWSKRFHPLEITIAESKSSLVNEHSPRVERIILKYLEEKGISHISNCRVESVDETSIHLENHDSLSYDFLLWATGGAPPQLLKHTDVETNETGFIRVRSTLQVVGYENIFAAGDCIDFVPRPLPKSGVYAVREGPILARNINAFLCNKPLTPYRPQTSALALLMTGQRNAIASRPHISFHGNWVWWLKNWIDQRWIKKFNPVYLPPMSVQTDVKSEENIGEKAGMRCAGCGAKVGSTILANILDELIIYDREDILVGLSDGDDAAIIDIPAGKSLVQTVDGFRTFTGDLNLFGRIALVHATSDLYAMGAEPHSALVNVTLPFAEKQIVANDLRQLMDGIAKEAKRLGITLLGGHTSEGAEAAVSLTINGLIDKNKAFRKGGLNPGDGLILTKPVGTGVILAADMRLKAKGVWIDQILEGMLQSNAQAAQILAQADIPSVTDVTGFGLAGHLAEMLQASNTGAKIELGRIPRYPGSGYCLAEGITSTLAPSNRENLKIRWDLEIDAGIDTAILFDPQTSGGLLAGVPPSQIDEMILNLQEVGYPHTALIGRVTERKRHLKLS